jgi:hypothetical protein
MANLEDTHMVTLRSLVATTALTFALAAPAFAQNISMELSDRQAIMIDTGGHVSRMNVSTTGHNKLMKYATRVHAGTIFYMSGGKLYMAQDRPMAGGRSLHDVLVQTN